MKQRYISIAAALLVCATQGMIAQEASTPSQGEQGWSADTTSILSTLHSETLQSTPEVQPATLKECLEKGLDKNYSLRIIRNEEQMAANNATMENAGLLPTVSLSAGYNGSAYGRNTEMRTDGSVSQERGVYDDGLNAGIDLSWTLFDGFKTVANYDRLRELSLISSTQTRLAVEDYMADLTAEYYNFIQQRQRLRNYVSAVELSRERLRIVYERWMIGSLSRLDLLQARVDFNADSAQCLKQREALASSRIRLHELMAEDSLNVNFAPAESGIELLVLPQFDSLWVQTKDNNASMIMASQNRNLAEIELRSVRSRNYPYLKLGAGYGYNTNHYGAGATLKRNQWGGDVGLTLGFNLYDGKRRSEQRNARLSVKNAELEEPHSSCSIIQERVWPVASSLLK